MIDGHELSLIVGGKRFGGWLDVHVQRSIEHASGSFKIGATQRWPGLRDHFRIEKGSPCEVWIGDDPVLTGYVDRVAGKRNGTSATLEVSGRSKTCDLVDCSPDYTMSEMANQSLKQVAERICQPFGIEVVAADDSMTYPVSSSNKGETAWKMIERLARQARMLVMDDERGRLVLAHLASERSTDTLVHPADGLLDIGFVDDMSHRFSIYKVKAQAGGARWADVDADKETVATSLAHVEGAFIDPEVPRYRPKTIANEGAAKKTGALARAEWEARRNIGKSRKINATRVGWRQRDGSLWRPNLLVPCALPQLNIDPCELALATVRYIKSNSGTLLEMELAPPEAFTPEPPETPAGAGGQGARWGDAVLGSGKE